ncbi:probable TSR1 Protein required for processing of 20S pre-rRNA in the cytoplasm, associates with pre-40S ribosomal particles [Cephalotrichum gorgonifer]|uniref:Probable TSR1 Protein required for processing of 20S pre-rRNA in the cytoplasm, associates with pre-40S ribosomal particles n=1 Tax=Cephalotrichum gorgonifer TaxID=2041049 RepID=A0AAE8N5M5_9PEZI|nr:probable TSR1 Protein required for processing of 20S pre-rRNA in the cytoplasm, associates with pre-40S ribosomal particles [Cephalotrichum gorgonifer]
MPVAVAHSHRATTKTTHKAFKSRKATKGDLRDRAKGRVERGVRRTPHQNVMTKFDRRNQAKQKQLSKRKEHQQETQVFAGRDGAPRIVAVIPLCHDADAHAAVKHLNDSLDIEAEVQDGCHTVQIDRFKQKLMYMPVKRDLTSCLDAARAADFVIIILSADVEVDQLGELILRSIENQGLSTLYTAVHGLGDIESAKHKQQTLSSLKSYITHFHPDQEKLFSLNNRQDCTNLMRSLCSTTPKGIKWREERSWMLVENVQFLSSPSDAAILTGVVRGRGLKADRLVQVGDWGTFQIEKITAAPLAPKAKGAADVGEGQEGSENILDAPTDDRDDIADLAPEEIAMDYDDGMTDVGEPSKKGVLLDDHHYFSEDEEEQTTVTKKRLPRGTSAYQSAWYLDDGVSDSGSDVEDYDEEEAQEEVEARPEDGFEGYAGREPTEAGPSEYPQSEMMIEPNEEADAEQLAAFRSSRNGGEAAEDKEFPDEIELHPNVLARERLARYRGLKSLRTSTWQEDEDRAHEPEEWRRLLQISDYTATRNRTMQEALVGGVAPGTRVHVHLRGVPSKLQEAYNPAKPVTLFSLLRHENKKTAVNFLINFSSDYPHSIKSKEELIMQCGPRRMVINPQFSLAGTTPNNVHKFCRFLHPGQSAVATFMGPVTWGSVPALFYKRTVDGQAESSEESNVGLTLIATGTALPPSTSRVIAKRIVLTGHPYHINKRVVTVRYMFFNKEDVDWFKALPLWTKRGRSGYVKETLGTHGYFKATFDGRINPQDAVGVSLYKRVWPRNARPLEGPLVGAPVEEVNEDGMDMDG